MIKILYSSDESAKSLETALEVILKEIQLIESAIRSQEEEIRLQLSIINRLADRAQKALEKAEQVKRIALGLDELSRTPITSCTLSDLKQHPSCKKIEDFIVENERKVDNFPRSLPTKNLLILEKGQKVDVVFDGAKFHVTKRF